MATITSINPFPYDVRTAFEAYSNSTTYYNREQFSLEQLHHMHQILEDPSAYISQNKGAVNLKTRTQFSFILLDHKLYRKSDARHLQPRYVVPKAEVLILLQKSTLSFYMQAGIR